MRSIWFALLTMVLLGAVASPAAAQSTAYAAGQGSVNSIAVGIEVRASVRDRCGFTAAPSGSLDKADFDLQGFSKDFAIVLNCTGASRIAVSSRNGGLTTETVADGLASKAPYDVELRMVADNGAAATATCGAAGLTTGGACAFAGAATGSTGLRLGSAATKSNGSYLRVKAPAYSGSAPLIAGRYGDTLTVTVSAAT